MPKVTSELFKRVKVSRKKVEQQGSTEVVLAGHRGNRKDIIANQRKFLAF